MEGTAVYHKNQYRELLVKTIGNRQVMLSELVEVKRIRPLLPRTSTKMCSMLPLCLQVPLIASGLSGCGQRTEPPTFLFLPLYIFFI